MRLLSHHFERLSDAPIGTTHYGTFYGRFEFYRQVQVQGPVPRNIFHNWFAPPAPPPMKWQYYDQNAGWVDCPCADVPRNLKEILDDPS
jgi:hypothetical protein